MEKASTQSLNREQYSQVNRGAFTRPQNKGASGQTQRNSHESSIETHRGENRGQGQGPQCHACKRFGHIARNCRFRSKRGAEAPGKFQDSNAELTAREELSKRKLDREQELVGE